METKDKPLTLKERITKILYQNSSDDSECLRIKFETIDKVIDSIVNIIHINSNNKRT